MQDVSRAKVAHSLETPKGNEAKQWWILKSSVLNLEIEQEVSPTTKTGSRTAKEVE